MVTASAAGAAWLIRTTRSANLLSDVNCPALRVTLFPNSASITDDWDQERAGYTYGLYGTPTSLELAARICELYLTDDLSFKQDFKFIDGSLPQGLRFVLGHTGLKAGLAERFRAIVNIFQNGGEISRELIETRCHRGADIARKMRFSEPVADGIKNLDEHWDGGGKPLGLRGVEIPIYSRIALMAQ